MQKIDAKLQEIDAELVRATLRGNVEAFEQLARKHRSLLLGYVLKRVKNLVDAEDIVQEALLKAYQHLATLRDKEKFAGWLYAIASNLCASWLRKQNNNQKSLEIMSNNPQPETATPLEILLQQEFSDSVVKAVQALPDKNRRIFTLYLDGVSYKDIASTLNISQTTVSGRLQTAKKQLREKISVPTGAVSDSLKMAAKKLREEIFVMEVKQLFRRRIYGISQQYSVVVFREASDSGGKTLSTQNAIMYLFREIISGRMYPDVFLDNGGRIHNPKGSELAHFATPECDSIAQLILYEKASERIARRLSLAAQNRMNRDGFSGTLSVFKNNAQLPGSTAERRENYLTKKQKVSVEKLRNQLIPFLVTRQIFAGAGKVTNGETYAISQRASYVEEEISVENENSIIRMPKEPYADKERYLRLQILAGDSNMSEWTSYLKVGSTALVLQMIEDDFLDDKLALQNPVEALRQIAPDQTLSQKVALQNGKQLMAIEIQKEYLDSAKKYLDVLGSDASTGDILSKWEHALSCLSDEPMQLASQVDWVIKKKAIWSAKTKPLCSELQKLDLQYHNISPEDGLYCQLEKEGKVDRIVTDEEVNQALSEPPETTRAKFRGRFVRLANDRKILCGVNWAYIQLYEPFQKLFLSIDPLKSDYEEASRMNYSDGTKKEVEVNHTKLKNLMNDVF